MSLEKVRNRVNKHRNWATNAMKANPNARNNDWELLFTALELNGVPLSSFTKQKIIETGINYHSLLRERQRIQSSGDLLPTCPKVLKSRRLLASYHAEIYGE